MGALKLAKIGLIAKFWNVILGVILAAKKALFVGLAALGAWFKRMFGKKKGAAPAVLTGAPPDLPGPPPAA